MLFFFATQTHETACDANAQSETIVLGMSGSLACITAALTARKKHFFADGMAVLGIYSGVIYLLHTITKGPGKDLA